MSDAKKLELVIIGAGPAGLTAAIYAQRALLDAVTIEQESFGGQTVLTSDIENYPGVPNTDGFTLSDTMHRQAEDLGATFAMDVVTGLEHDPATGMFTVTAYGATYESKTVILAGGATPRPAGFVGEKEFSGRGVSYCATCDGMFYRGKQVFVIGGGNSACEEALFLTRFANKVTLIVRKDHLRAQASVAREIEQNEKVEVRYLTSVVGVTGDALLKSILFRANTTGEVNEETYEEGSVGVFVFVGRNPASQLVEGLTEIDANGYVVTNERMETSTPGLYCAGDVRAKSLRQIVTAAADGAIAATSASAYLGHPIEG